MRFEALRALLTIVLVAAQLLLPIEHALARANAGWSDLCSADGVRRVPAPDGPEAPLHGDHCPLCRTADTTPGLVPALPVAAPSPAVHEVPSHDGSEPAARQTRHDARARAPPHAG